MNDSIAILVITFFALGLFLGYRWGRVDEYNHHIHEWALLFKIRQVIDKIKK